jgi:NADH:ubiquinone oxidoreductase subunit 4 (chain M)
MCFFCFLCCIDIVFRFISLRDLKAIVAYSSILHTNLLIALIHLDSSKIFKTSIYYIWGHSLATTSIFIIISVIEMKYGSRNILFISGLWYNSPNLCILSIISLISFLDIPISIFFWGELWLWIVCFNQVFFLVFEVLFLVNIVFTSIFFKIWWCIFLVHQTILLKKMFQITWIMT